MREEPVTPIPNDVERMFQTHHGLVFRTAYRITGNAADAEDVLQTVFLRMMRRDNAARALERQDSYFRRAAINAALDIVRAGKDAHNVPIDDVPPDQLGPSRREPDGRELPPPLPPPPPPLTPSN